MFILPVSSWKHVSHMLQNGALINAGNVKRHLETKHSFWAQLSPKVQAECTQNNRTANPVWRMYSKQKKKMEKLVFRALFAIFLKITFNCFLEKLTFTLKVGF